MTKEEIDKHIQFAEAVIKNDRDIADTFECAISTADLIDYLAYTKIICGGQIMQCTEVWAKAKDGTTWHIKNFAKELCKEDNKKSQKVDEKKINFREFL